jgi:hypothetical protein
LPTKLDRDQVLNDSLSKINDAKNHADAVSQLCGAFGESTFDKISDSKLIDGLDKIDKVEQAANEYFEKMKPLVPPPPTDSRPIAAPSQTNADTLIEDVDKTKVVPPAPVFTPLGKAPV